MKVQLSLDKQTIRDFFLQHMEKIGFGVVVVGFLLIVFKAHGRGSFDRSPQDLIANANNAEKHWKGTPADAELQTIDYNEKVDQIKEDVKASDYPQTTLWSPPLFEERGKRGIPPLLSVQKLRGQGGMGAFNMKSERAPLAATQDDGSRSTFTSQASFSTRGQRWIVLTGLVPVQEQRTEYELYFMDRQEYDPQNDVPEYIYFRIERAEVSLRSGAGQLSWTPLNVRDALSIRQQWNGQGEEVVDLFYLEKALTFPLGPLVGREWGEEVAYPPYIPLGEPRGPRSSDTPGESEPQPGDEPGADVPAGLGGTGGARSAPAERRSPGPPGAMRQAEYKLFRFFDFTVEPGKRYRYRVRLMVKNPSYGMDRRHLEEDVNPEYLEQPKPGQTMDLSRSRWLLTPWCEPTEVIAVPEETQVLAVGVNPRPRPGAEPTAKLMVVKFVEEYGMEAHKEFTVGRGKVINFPGCEYPESNEPKNKKAEEENLNLPYGKREETVSIPVDYITDTLALDMRGGDRLPGNDRLCQPGEILLLDPAGVLVVHNEVEDRAEYQRRVRRGEQGGEGPGTLPVVGGSISAGLGNLDELHNLGGSGSRR